MPDWARGVAAMNETRAALRRLRVYAILLAAIAVYGLTEPHRDTLADKIRHIIQTGDPR